MTGLTERITGSGAPSKRPRWVAAIVALLVLAAALAAVALRLGPWAARPPDLRPFVMTIEQWDAARMSFPDGRTAGGTAVWRLEYHRRDHWTLTLVSDELGAMAPGHGQACRDGTQGTVEPDGTFRATGRDPALCNGVHRWIHPGLACCYPWRREEADGRITYTDPGERVVFDARTGLPLVYEAGPVNGPVGQRIVYRVERWLGE